MEKWVYRKWDNGLSIYRSPGRPIKMLTVLIAQHSNFPLFHHSKCEVYSRASQRSAIPINMKISKADIS